MMQNEIILIFCIVLLSVLLTAYTVWYIFKNPRYSNKAKIVLTILLIFSGPLGCIVYFMLRKTTVLNNFIQ